MVTKMKYKDCITFDELYKSMLKCKKGVLYKSSVAHYYLNGIEETIRLKDELQNGTFKPRKSNHFTIYVPKRRDIVSISFRDRVHQRALNDNIIYPVMSKSFIYDNCACQINKGPDFARKRLKSFLEDFYRHHTINGYVLQIDIHGYYPNMSHEYTEKLFKSNLDSDVFPVVKQILDRQYEGNVGYNPGSQLIQIAGIAILNKLDHICKENLHLKYYVRYMDDFIILCDNYKYLHYCFQEIENVLFKIGFTFNKNKTRIFQITKSIPFLGFNFKLLETGKILMIRKPEEVKRNKKHIKNLVKLAKQNVISKDKVDECVGSICNFLDKGNSYNLKRKILDFYSNLLEDNNYG